MEVGSLAAGYDGSIRINTKLDRNGFNQGLNAIAGSLKKLGGAMGVAFGVTAMVKFGKEALNIASDLTEVQNVVETAFGAMTSQVDAWAKNSIQQFGMSELAAKRTASTYMAMNAGMGLVGQGAADMAMEVAGRTADIASFFNTSQEEADTMLKSIWTGETESLKRIGVVMTQTNLDAYALANGFGKTVQQMTQSEQVMLRYQYVMNQTRLAAGDFVKTQDSWANQTRILSEQWKQFLGIIGQGLIQVLTPALKFLNQMMGVLIQWAQTFAAVTGALFGKQQQQANASAAAVGNVADTSNAAADGQNALASATKKAGKEAKGALASFDQLNVLERSTADTGAAPGTGAATGVGTAVAVPAIVDEPLGVPQWIADTQNALARMRDDFAPSFESAVKKFEKPFARFKQSIFEFVARIQTLKNPLSEWFNGDFTAFLQQAIDTISTILAGLFDSFSLVFGDVLNLVLYPSLETFTATILPTITQAATEFMSALSVLFTEIKRIFDQLWTEGARPALGCIAQLWNDLWGSIQQAWQNWGKPIFDGVKEAFRNTANIIQNVWETILKPVWDTFMETLDWLWKEHLKPLVDGFLDFCGTLADGALQIYNKFIAPLVNWIVNAFGPPIRNAFQMVVSVIGSVIGTVVDVAKGIIKALKGVINFVVGVFTSDWRKAWEGIKQAFKGIVDSFGGILKGVVNVVIDLINTMIRAMTNGINTVIRAANKLSFTPPDWVPGIGGETFGFNIKEIQAYQIPKLAQGAVIPPNQQFAAILGDQTHGRNLEAPEGLIRQIVREETGNVYNDVLRAINNSNLSRKAVIAGDVIMDGQKVGRLVAKPVFKEGNRAGYIKVKV
jgi:hypothetical protein